MNVHPQLPTNAIRTDNGVLSEAEVMAIFQPLSDERVREFGLQVDEELKRLEERFAQFTTAKSVRNTLGR